MFGAKMANLKHGDIKSQQNKDISTMDKKSQRPMSAAQAARYASIITTEIYTSIL
jgi:hypothetical protein